MEGWRDLCGCLVTTAVAGSSACGGTPATTSHDIQLVTNAAGNMSNAGGIRFHFTSSGAFTGEKVTVTGDGAADFRARRFLLHLSGNSGGRHLDQTALYEPERVLYEVPANRQNQTQGRHWVARPLAENEKGVNPAQNDALVRLKEVGATIRRRGREHVNGVTAIHYRVDKRATTKREPGGGTETIGGIHGDVWLTRTGLPVRVIMRYTMTGNRFDTTGRGDYFDIGKTPNIPRPPASDVLTVPDDRAAQEIVSPTG